MVIPSPFCCSLARKHLSVPLHMGYQLVFETEVVMLGSLRISRAAQSGETGQKRRDKGDSYNLQRLFFVF